MNNNNSKNINIDSKKDGEIDLKIFLKILLRNKILIIIFSASFFAISCLYAISKKRVWEGQFQIVLSKDSNEMGASGSNLSDLANIVGLNISNSSQSSLKTEVGILESPSVLMPVFEFVKKEQEKLRDKTLYKNFLYWKGDNLNIELQRGTSILDISYRDKNKDIIIPTLNKMAEVYQDYSGKNTRRKITLTKLYVNNQIKEYKEKSFNSIKKAQEFALDQDLSILDLNTKSGKSVGGLSIDPTTMKLNNSPTTSNDQLGDNIGIEVARVRAANEIKRIDLQIEKIKDLESTNDNLQFMSITVPGIVEEGLPEELRELNLEIIEMQSKYTEDFQPLKNLITKRRILIDLLKDRAIGFLKAERIIAETKMQVAKRPKGVLLKYKSLIREANRDETTLIQLENLLRSIELEESKIEDPWKLITQPTLRDAPVAPSRTRYGLIGLILGVIAGVSFAIIKEKRTNLIYEDSELEFLLNTKVFEKLEWNTYNSGKVKNENFINNLRLIGEDKTIKLFASKNLEKSKLDSIKKELNTKNNFSYTYDLRDLNDKDTILFVTSIPLIDYEEVYSIKKLLAILNKSIYRIVLL